ncbi:MarR family transcriptional regulator [Aureimonas sp. SA4125]|uniref:MarR family winged helix-turn-helix transcriptional regulator n=1 Tax=Aureimonas sp. SA4125 TaxID=2826993 RepID=UPI001CC47859|nr:MarR family transcriptional regulator [Aureimonas sp. SA4125]BDA86725.1 MarR family transcriptional regulator [Aureimonas sp. SA4125]
MTQIMPENSLGFLLNDLSRLFRQAFEKSMGDAGLVLTPGEIRALAHVARHGGARQAVLAERMGVEPMTLSAYLDRLETRGLIIRTTDPTDRRAKVIHLTDRADDVIDQVRPLAAQIYAQITDGIDAGELRTMESALLRIRDNLAQTVPFVSFPNDLLPMGRSARA